MGKKKILQTIFLPSLFAGSFILIAFQFISFVDTKLLFAAIGASTYIAFMMVDSKGAHNKSMFGGYFIGAIWGILASLGRQFFILNEIYTIAIFCALAVLFTVFFMKALNLEHPPAAALTISITISNNPIIMSLIALIVIIALGLWQKLYLKITKQLKSKN